MYHRPAKPPGSIISRRGLYVYLNRQSATPSTEERSFRRPTSSLPARDFSIFGKAVHQDWKTDAGLWLVDEQQQTWSITGCERDRHRIGIGHWELRINSIASLHAWSMGTNKTFVT
jgi:hypothetical protein